MILFGLAGLKAAELHGNLTQLQRLQALDDFKQEKVDILLCTDLAGRGIDIQGVEAVINFEMPRDITAYVHRVGRTARAGRRGRAITLTGESRRQMMKQVVQHCKGLVQSRAVPPLVIDQWRERIEHLEKDVQDILEDERLDKSMRLVEMEANKAQNVMEHEAEIYSRPAKTWFQSDKERTRVQEAAKNAKDAMNGDGGQQDDLEFLEPTLDSVSGKLTKEKREAKGAHRLNRKKRRRLELLKDMAKEERIAHAEEGRESKKNRTDTFEDMQDKLRVSLDQQKGQKRKLDSARQGEVKAKAGQAINKARGKKRNI
jgi:ATP-dependent RNA helicase DDX27